MKKKKIVLCLILLVLTVACFRVFFHTPEKTIVKVLETKPYSYLSEKAKDYIEDVYEETGEIISTEENKEENVPYLNPKFIHYLELSEEEREGIDEIPTSYTVDFPVDGATNDLPVSYDLRNVNGTSYVTDIKNQGSLDLCWSFTAVEQAESYAKKKLNKSYVFSTRQMDYACSTNGIKDYENENGSRELASGGNYFISSVLLSNGLGLVNESVMPFSNTTEKKELSEVLNFGNSIYELDSTMKLPAITRNTTTSERKNIISLLKQLVMEYGGAYVGTEGPGYSCSAVNADSTYGGNYIIRVDDTCELDGGHAMQIIGWNDNYTYKYCKTGTKHTSNISNCSGTVVTGTGAWLLRNSWGSTYPYVYLAYESFDDDFNVFTSLSPMASRNWDNNYHKTVEAYTLYFNSSYSTNFTKSINTHEKVQKVKFYSYGKNGSYTVSISSNKESYPNIKTVNVSYPGIVTVDLSNLNVVITDSSFTVEVTSNNNIPLLRNTTAVFTSNVDKTPTIQASVPKVTVGSLSSNYTTRVYTNTKNIPSNSLISYSFFNSTGASASSYFGISNNKVAKNDLNPLLTIKSTTPVGVYTMRMTYQNTTKDIPIIVGNASYKIVYYPNGGTGSSVTQNVTPLSSFSLRANSFTRTGYQFTKWNTKANGSGTNYNNSQAMNPISQDMTLYALWSPITYSIKFLPNGGTGSMNNQTLTYATSANLTANAFTRSGYKFVSWNTKADGTGTSYKDKVSVTNLTTTQGEVIKLYAIWESIPTGNYTISHYTVDYQQKTIDFIEANTSKSKYSSYFNLPSGYTLQIDMKGKDVIATGSTVKIMNGTKQVDQLTNIVRGDTNGDGKISALDYVKVKNHIMGSSVIPDGVYKKGADINNDNKISALDYVQIKNVIMNGGK